MERARSWRGRREDSGFLLCEAGHLLPDLDHVVVTAAEEELSLGTYGDGERRSRMSGEGVDQPASFEVPNLDRTVFTTTGEESAVRTNRYGPNPVRVFEGVEWFIGLQAPYPDRPICTATD